MLSISEQSDGFDWGMLSEFFTVDEMDRINKMRAIRANLSNNSGELLKKCIERLRDAHIKDKSLEDIINEKRSDRRRI